MNEKEVAKVEETEPMVAKNGVTARRKRFLKMYFERKFAYTNLHVG